MGFLKFLLIALLVYYAFLLAWKWLMPRVLRYFAKRAFSSMEQRFGTPPGSYSQAQDEPGKVSWSKRPPKPKKKGEKVGEYIEFEEIE